jgi:hypothetical protein
VYPVVFVGETDVPELDRDAGGLLELVELNVDEDTVTVLESDGDVNGRLELVEFRLDEDAVTMLELEKAADGTTELVEVNIVEDNLLVLELAVTDGVDDIKEMLELVEEDIEDTILMLELGLTDCVGLLLLLGMVRLDVSTETINDVVGMGLLSVDTETTLPLECDCADDDDNTPRSFELLIEREDEVLVLRQVWRILASSYAVGWASEADLPT